MSEFNDQVDDQLTNPYSAFGDSLIARSKGGGVLSESDLKEIDEFRARRALESVDELVDKARPSSATISDDTAFTSAGIALVLSMIAVVTIAATAAPEGSGGPWQTFAAMGWPATIGTIVGFLAPFVLIIGSLVAIVGHNFRVRVRAAEQIHAIRTEAFEMHGDHFLDAIPEFDAAMALANKHTASGNEKVKSDRIKRIVREYQAYLLADTPSNINELEESSSSASGKYRRLEMDANGTHLRWVERPAVVNRLSSIASDMISDINSEVRAAEQRAHHKKVEEGKGHVDRNRVVSDAMGDLRRGLSSLASRASSRKSAFESKSATPVTPTVPEPGDDQMHTSREMWVEGKEILAAVREDLAAFETDVYAVFERPLLRDVTIPQVARFYDDLDAVTVLDFSSPPDAETARKYLTAARQARASWNAADRYARQVGVSSMSTEDSDMLRRARKSLDRALDPSVSDHERALAMNRCIEMVTKVAGDSGAGYLSEHVRVLTERRQPMLCSPPRI